MPELREDAGYSAIHKWMRTHHPKAGVCDQCGCEARTHYAAKDHGNYTRNREDYMELCPRCHVHHDDRIPPSRRGVKLDTYHIEALQAGRRRQREAQNGA